ncbi:2-oxo acid dehydrogenase subunit E2 [Nocardia coubleae]|uniref:Dihydrolipoamide acetyltransferase component of pyruvate dehydrogenase complex n=2 Tax=Nocardia coubleae TaxID=356147 RepID=A0A846W154_9NOCA|nr:dihydrolipoamide acetyltransferase family protein [Nocardia coubleae]NKX86882.1 2-oxo acid dehydrogenase subunit E2 [Nocardia coubleae]
MPRLSDTMEEGVVVAWLKKVGDTVEPGEILAEIETDKALMELEAYDHGVLEQILATEGTRVAIGAPIGMIGDGTATTAPAPPPVPHQRAVLDQPPNAAALVQANASTSGNAPRASVSRPKASPLARKIAAERGIDITALTGTGPGGRITRQDVENAADTTSPENPGTTTSSAGSPATPSSTTTTCDHEQIPLTTVQQISATRLTESKQTAPHIYLTVTIDVTELLAFRTRLNDTLATTGTGKISLNDLLIKAVATTLRSHPAVNVSFAGDHLLRHHHINIGMAVATPTGLLVPVLHDADRKSITEIATESRDKAERARNRKLRTDEMSAGTFTISNLGMYGIRHFTAVINPPEAAILAVGAVTDQLRLAGDEVVARKTLQTTMSADHRAIDGAVAARFLHDLMTVLENPLRIVT